MEQPFKTPAIWVKGDMAFGVLSKFELRFASLDVVELNSKYFSSEVNETDGGIETVPSKLLQCFTLLDIPKPDNTSF